jgi:hypothetical protein
MNLEHQPLVLPWFLLLLQLLPLEQLSLLEQLYL